MKVLVTGGAGFIGSHLCERLLRNAYEVAIIDDLNSFYSPDLKRENLSAVRQAGSVVFHQADICDEVFITNLVDEIRPDAVIHLAARAGVRPSLERPVLYERTNVGGTTVLLEAARRAGVRKFVFASSSSIYGGANRVPFSEEDESNRPYSPYAATKIAGEKLCYAYSHLYEMQIVCLRFFTVYGPRQRPDLAIRKFAAMMLEHRPIPVFGDGSSGRDYTYIDDIIEGIVSALHFETRYEVFNLGNSSPVTLSAMIETLESALGLRARLQRFPDQPGDVPITFASIEKACTLLGFKPVTPFKVGIGKFVTWYESVRGTGVEGVRI